MRKFGAWMGVVWCVSACAPPEAPTELSELSRYMYREWDSDDDRVRVAGMVNLDTFLSGVDLTVESTDDRAWEVADLQDEDVATIKRPDRPIADCIGISIAKESRWPIADHAKLQMCPDQRLPEPSATFYDRAFLNVEDGTCFPDQGCPVVETSNHMERKNLLLTVESTLLKNFRWVPYTDANGDEHDAFYTRSWYDQSWPGKKENTTIWQSYSIDVWIDRGDGKLWRYQALWSESDVGFAASDETTLATLRPGIDKTFDAGDDAIDALFHGDGTAHCDAAAE